MRAIDISKNDRILILAPHPDDECIGSGGVLLRFPDQCDVVVLTDGRQGQGDIPPEEGKEIRKREFVREMMSLGIQSYAMKDIEDGTLLAHTDCLDDMDLSVYEFIFVTGLNDDHPDHKAALLCLKNAMNSGVGIKHPRCFLYEVHTPLQCPTHFLDITDVIDEKLDLIRIHKSQLRDLPFDELARQNAAYRATLFRMPGKKVEVYEEIDLSEDVNNLVSETEILLQKERLIGWTLKRWVCGLIQGKTISNYFASEAFDEFYVYGYGELGRLLLSELKNEGMRVKAVIDRRAKQFGDEEVAVILPGEAESGVPVIVTVVFEYDELERNLKCMGFEKVFSLKKIMESV